MDTVVVISDDSSDELNNFIIWNYVFVWSFDMQHTICNILYVGLSEFDRFSNWESQKSVSKY